MQLANCTVRLGGSLNNTVPKANVTPAEILILRHIHGQDAVVDIRPTGKKSKLRHEQEYDRLASKYDRGAGAFVGAPGDDTNRGVMSRLFPGAVKKLPVTLAEIGADPTVAEPIVPELDDEDEIEADADGDGESDEQGEAPEGGENAAGGEAA